MRAIGPIGRLHIHRPASQPILPTLPCLILDSPLNLNFPTENQPTSRVRVLSDTKRHLNRAIFHAFMANWLGFIIIPIPLPHLERAKTKSKNTNRLLSGRVHPEVGVRIPSLSSYFSPFLLPIGAPFPNITLPKRKRIISYLFNGFTIEQRIHQSFFLSMHMKRIEPTYLLN